MSDDSGYDYHSKEEQLRRGREKWDRATSNRQHNRSENQQDNGGGCIVLLAAMGVASTFLSYGFYYLFL